MRGRKAQVVIQAGMDTFIWLLPYSRAEWLSMFPDGRGRILEAPC